MLVGVATMISNAAAYLLSMGAARLLSVPGYGAFGSLLAISLIGSTAAVSAQTVAARQFAANATHEPERRLTLASHTMRLSLAILLAGAVGQHRRDAGEGDHQECDPGHQSAPLGFARRVDAMSSANSDRAR